MNKSNALCHQRTQCCEKLPGLITSYFELQYRLRPPTLLFTHHPKLSFSCPPPPPPPSPPHHCRAKCLPACYASSKKNRFRLGGYRPGRLRGKTRSDFQGFLGFLQTLGALGGTVERVSSSLLRDVDKNNQKVCRLSPILTRQKPEPHDILTGTKRKQEGTGESR